MATLVDAKIGPKIKKVAILGTHDTTTLCAARSTPIIVKYAILE